MLPIAQTTVVIVPLVALKQDLLQRCRQWRLSFATYDTAFDWSHRLHAVPPLVFVDIDVAVSVGFQTFLQSLQRDGRLDRLVIDEAYLILTASHYREKLGLLGVLRRVLCPLVCITATLPFTAVFSLKDQLRLTQLETIRTSSDRLNLKYCVQTIDSPNAVPKRRIDNDLLISYAMAIC